MHGETLPSLRYLAWWRHVASSVWTSHAKVGVRDAYRPMVAHGAGAAGGGGLGALGGGDSYSIGGGDGGGYTTRGSQSSQSEPKLQISTSPSPPSSQKPSLPNWHSSELESRSGSAATAAAAAAAAAAATMAAAAAAAATAACPPARRAATTAAAADGGGGEGDGGGGDGGGEPGGGGAAAAAATAR